ncbi:MAG: hypothetical protein AAF763_10215 [Pseudomonadota bacterium]
MQFYTASQTAAFIGEKTDRLHDWRRIGLFSRPGGCASRTSTVGVLKERFEDGTPLKKPSWRYSARDVLVLAVMRALNSLGVDLESAFDASLHLVAEWFERVLTEPKQAYDLPRFIFLHKPGSGRPPMLVVGGSDLGMSWFDYPNDVEDYSDLGGWIIFLKPLLRSLPRGVLDLWDDGAERLFGGDAEDA